MTHALWVTTNAYDRGDDAQLWFARREEVIYYNLKSKMTSATDRMVLHMGAAHTNKHALSGGSRTAQEYELTKGQVFSIAPAYGDGSVIWYGQDMDLPGEPETLTSALTKAPANPFFVSTTRPNAACEKNPFGLEQEPSVGGGGARAELSDGYVHYGKLTSERRPEDTTFSRDIAVAGADESAGGVQGVTAGDARVALKVDFRARVQTKASSRKLEELVSSAPRFGEPSVEPSRRARAVYFADESRARRIVKPGFEGHGSTSGRLHVEMTTTVDLGTAFSGSTIKIRFRAGTDEGTGANGWDITRVSVEGITNTPFPSRIAVGLCPCP